MRRRQLPFGLTVLASLVVLFAPGPAVPSVPPGSDKLVHLGMFALLTGTGLLAGLRRRPLAVGLVGYAALSEVLQAVLPIRRDGSVADALADAAGIALGLGLLAVLRSRRRGRSTTG